MQKLKKCLVEVVTAIMPMTVLIYILSFTIAPFTRDMLISFTSGALMMILGLTLFLYGAESSMMEVGTRIGSYLVKKRSLVILILLGFLIGFVVTIAEPDVQVLAGQVQEVSQGAVPRMLLISLVGIGVGVFLVIALLRVVFRVRLLHIMLAGYVLCFFLTAFCNPTYSPLAFDSGGVTTGPMTVPFILALGTGITNVVRTSKDGNDSFGMVGISSLGSVLAVLILGVVYR